MGLVEYAYSFRIITEMHSVNSAGALQSGGSLLFSFRFSILGGSYFVCVDFKKYSELVVIVFFFTSVHSYLIVLLILPSMQGIF